MAIRPCSECKREISTDAATCPHCGKKAPQSGAPWKWILGAVAAVALVKMCAPGPSEPDHKFNYKSAAEAAPTPAPPPAKPLPLVEAEQRLLASVGYYAQEYDKAPNELKKSDLRTKRAAALREHLGGRMHVENWLGTLSEMKTTSDRKAVVTIKLPGGVASVKTWNNAFSDHSDNTLIDQGTTLYNHISEMPIGTTVTFSGEFRPASDDFIKEASMGEHGAMTTPEFIMQFTEIRKW